MDELIQKASMPAPQIQEKRHGSKMTLFIFGAVMVVLIGFGAYLLGANKAQVPIANNSLPQPSVSPADETANPDSMGANWKTYTNTQNDYSIQYPDSWKQTFTGVVSEKDPNAVAFYDTTSGSGKLTYNRQDQTIYYIYVNVFPNQNDLGVFVTTRTKDISVTSKNTTFNGLPALKTFYKGSVQSPSDVSIYFVNNNKGYKIQYLLISLSSSDESPVVPDILSTFKFTQ